MNTKVQDYPLLLANGKGYPTATATFGMRVIQTKAAFHWAGEIFKLRAVQHLLTEGVNKELRAVLRPAMIIGFAVFGQFKAILEARAATATNLNP